MRPRRSRGPVAAALLGAAVLGLAALGVAAIAFGPRVPAALAQGPVRIGFVAPLSGAIAQAGKDMYSGCELYGRNTAGSSGADLFKSSSKTTRAIQRQHSRKLVESDKVHMLAGVILSNVAYALVPYVEAQGIPTIYPINSADDLTRRKRPRWLVRTGFAASGNMHPFGEYAATRLAYKRVAIVALDYAFGVARGRWTQQFAQQWATSGLKDKVALIAQVEIADARRGPMRMDSYGNPIQNIYVRKVERVNGKLQNTVIFTYPNVSQFWKSSPEEFLKQPVYSRDFPPCRHCA